MALSRVLTEAFAETYAVRGVAFPERLRFRRILVVGPPGTGKSTLLTRVGGWPEEGYIDLASDRWWTSKVLSIRPRQVHLGLPFAGFAEAMAVYDRAVCDARPPPAIDFARIRLPEPPRHFFSMDWRRKFAFEFLLPPADVTFAQRAARAPTGSHPVDEHLTRADVGFQTRCFWQLAGHLWQHGFYVYVRRGTDAGPERIAGVDSIDEPDPPDAAGAPPP